jgi:hypothetical protein
VNLVEDCTFASCPPQAPYPIGCTITMEGNDARGCVANTPGTPLVYFQEGDACPLFPGCGAVCGAGSITGILACSSQPGATLGPASCAINKAEPHYPADAAGCP